MKWTPVKNLHFFGRHFVRCAINRGSGMRHKHFTSRRTKIERQKGNENPVQNYANTAIQQFSGLLEISETVGGFSL